MSMALLDRMLELERKIEEDIAGPRRCSVMGIFATEDDRPTAPFNYTIGLSDLGWPELIMAGVDNRVAAQIINTIVERCLADGAPKVGQVMHQVIADYPVRFKAISDQQRDDYLCWAINRQQRVGRAEPRALQVEFPDEAGRWPDDPECDPKVQFIQSLPTDEQKEQVQ
jgi:hypothetical protein